MYQWLECENCGKYQAGEIDWEYTWMKDMNEISHIDTEKYLGQFLSKDSKNTFNITMLRNKGVGIKKNMIQILEKMPGGEYHFEMAAILRNAMLIFSIPKIYFFQLVVIKKAN